MLFVLLGQVSLVQYSDDAKTEFKLNSYHSKGVVMSALKSVRYRGGNTKTGSPPTKNIIGNGNKRQIVQILCGMFASSRYCSEACLRESVHLRQWHEEECPEGDGGAH